MINLNKKTAALSVVLTSALVACGGFVYTTVGGTVTGLTPTGSDLILINDTGYRQDLTKDGNFSFRVASNGVYNIIVAQQPNLVNCTVANGSGKMTSEAPVNNIVVTCLPNVPLAGSLTGLASGLSLSLSMNGVTQTTLTADGVFSFQTYAVNGKEYAAKVALPPVGQVCKIQNASGIAKLASPPSNIAVTCATGVPIGGTLAGLKSGTFLNVKNVLPDGTVDERSLFADGAFTLNFSLANGDDYDLQVSTQPTGQKCTVSGGKSKASIANPALAKAINISCVAG